MRYYLVVVFGANWFFSAKENAGCERATITKMKSAFFIANLLILSARASKLDGRNSDEPICRSEKFTAR